MKHLYLILLLLGIGLLSVPIQAQDTSLEITGTVTIIDETTIEVGGLNVDISSISDMVIENGMIITVSGNLNGTTVIAITIVSSEPEATDEPEATEVPDAEATDEPEPEATDEPGPEATEEPDDDGFSITIVIEGPVKSIEANIITIYNFEIELAEDDPRITYIQIGDVMHIKGHRKGHHKSSRQSSYGSLVIIAIFFDFVDIDVIVVDGLVWRDSLSCNAGPPPWANGLALGWHARCDVIVAPVVIVPSGGKSSGMKKSKKSKKS